MSHLKTLGVFAAIALFILLTAVTHGWFAAVAILGLVFFMIYMFIYALFEDSRKAKARRARAARYNPVKERKWLS